MRFVNMVRCHSQFPRPQWRTKVRRYEVKKQIQLRPLEGARYKFKDRKSKAKSTATSRAPA